jgi:hypothetical protein
MGVKYIAVNGSVFSLDWNEHNYIYVLLNQLHADMREWSVAKDGAYISKSTCKQWANLLRLAVQKGTQEVFIPDPFCPGHYAKFPLLAGINKERELTVGSTSIFVRMLQVLNQTLELGSPEIELSSIKTRKISKMTRRWILDFAAFLENSGGCFQY